ncbi:MAG: hypothetical protein P8090_12460 [Gammaproteobacteria bacterium]
MTIRPVLVFAAVATLAGCAFGPTPQTAKEFRQGVVKGGLGTSHETYQVNAPYAKVATRVMKKGAECLNKVITIQSCVNSSCSNIDYIFKPKFNGTRQRSELSVQVKFKPDHSWYVGGPPPKDGMFVTVADITPAGRNKTKVATYGMSMGMYQYIPKAVKHWADGSNLGCPDLTAGM